MELYKEIFLKSAPEEVWGRVDKQMNINLWRLVHTFEMRMANKDFIGCSEEEDAEIAEG